MSDNLNNQDPKNRIIRTATALFAKFGFNGVSIRKICDASECNLAAISYHFGGKEKLYTECLRTIDPQWRKELDEILTPPVDRSDFEVKLKLCCHSTYQFLTLNAESVRLLINEMNSLEQVASNLDEHFLTSIFEIMEEFFNAGVEKKIINPEIEIKIVTRMIFNSIVTQILFEKFSLYKQTSHHEFTDKLIRTITRSLYV